LFCEHADELIAGANKPLIAVRRCQTAESGRAQTAGAGVEAAVNACLKTVQLSVGAGGLGLCGLIHGALSLAILEPAEVALAICRQG